MNVDEDIANAPTEAIIEAPSISSSSFLAINSKRTLAPATAGSSKKVKASEVAINKVEEEDVVIVRYSEESDRLEATREEKEVASPSKELVVDRDIDLETF